jgi:hypothetical protein
MRKFLKAVVDVIIEARMRAAQADIKHRNY